jgi:ubiquinone/menaquinone biosynthesis C-methylase UbiE
LNKQTNNVYLLKKLQLVQGRFPHINLSNASLDAVLASHVLPFLTGSEIEAGIKTIYEALKPGGKFFALSYTIYNKLMKNYIPLYEQRKANADPWPGELADASEYWDKNNALASILPKQLNHLEPALIAPLLENQGFKIEFLDFMALNNEIPDEVKLDGKEVIGLIAKK